MEAVEARKEDGKEVMGLGVFCGKYLGEEQGRCEWVRLKNS